MVSTYKVILFVNVWYCYSSFHANTDLNSPLTCIDAVTGIPVVLISILLGISIIAIVAFVTTVVAFIAWKRKSGMYIHFTFVWDLSPAKLTTMTYIYTYTSHKFFVTLLPLLL